MTQPSIKGTPVEEKAGKKTEYGKGMEYGANRPSKRAERRAALLWSMHKAKLACMAEMRRVKALRRQRLNLENKPLGVK